MDPTLTFVDPISIACSKSPDIPAKTQHHRIRACSLRYARHVGAWARATIVRTGGDDIFQTLLTTKGRAAGGAKSTLRTHAELHLLDAEPERRAHVFAALRESGEVLWLRAVVLRRPRGRSGGVSVLGRLGHSQHGPARGRYAV